MSHLCRVFTLIILSFVCYSCATVEPQKAAGATGQLSGSPFVTVSGDRFLRNGKPYYFAGTNFWYGAYLGSTEEGRARLTKELDALQQIGITNLRVLAAAEKTELTMAVSPALHLAPGQFNEQLLIGLDVLLAEMAKREMVAVLYLNNFWQWSGGMSQYMSWLTGEAPLDPDVTRDWNGFMQNSARFYRNEQAQQWYQDLIRVLVTRTNSVNGRVYSQDPTIMSWQLANEPRPGSDKDGRPFYQHYRDWIQATARFIKSLDSNHLVSTGSEGAMGTLKDLALYQDAHAVAEVDYLTFHMWPKNWRWFDATQAEATYAEAVAKSKAYILQHIEVAKALDKPLVLEEFGIERDAADYRQAATTVQRDRFFQEVFGLIENRVRLTEPLAGSNFWGWGGFGSAQSPDFVWRDGDPFTGDPPQEPQGLNSVFAADKSTLDILRRHAQFMNGR